MTYTSNFGFMMSNYFFDKIYQFGIWELVWRLGGDRVEEVKSRSSSVPLEESGPRIGESKEFRGLMGKADRKQEITNLDQELCGTHFVTGWD